jgi:hypothetical protein
LIFNFSLYNYTPGGFGTYEDIIRPIKAILEDLGHVVTRDNTLHPPPIINILFEGFDQPVNLDVLKRARAVGYRFVLVATEMPTHKTDHSFYWNDHRITYWLDRASGFVVALPYADAVWCVVQGTAEYLRKFHPHTADIELGYSPRLVNSTRVEPHYNFCIYGSPSERRFEITAQLRSRGHGVIENYTFPFVEERNRLVLSSRVVLDVKLKPHLTVVSTSRIVTSLHLGRPCISEPRGPEATQVQRWKRATRFAYSDDTFIDEAISMLPHWREGHREQFEALRNMQAIDILNDAVKIIPDKFPDVVEGVFQMPLPGKVLTIHQASAPDSASPYLLCSYNYHNIVAYGHEYFVIPQGIGEVNLALAIDRARPGIQRFPSEHEAKMAVGAI